MFKKFLEIEYFGRSRKESSSISNLLEENFLKKDLISMGYHVYPTEKTLSYSNKARYYFIKGRYDYLDKDKDFPTNIFSQFALKNDSINIVFNPFKEVYDYQDLKHLIHSDSYIPLEIIKKIAEYEKNKKFNIIIDHMDYFINNKNLDYIDFFKTIDKNTNINLICLFRDKLPQFYKSVKKDLKNNQFIIIENESDLPHLYKINNHQLVTARISSFKNLEKHLSFKNNNKFKIKNIYIKEFVSMSIKEINKNIFLENLT